MTNIDVPAIGQEKLIRKYFAVNGLSVFKSVSYLLLLAMLFLISSCNPDDDSKVVHIDKAIFSLEDQKAFGNNLQNVFLNAPNLFTPLSRSTYPQIYAHLDQTFQILTQTIEVENRDLFDWELTILKDDERKMAFCAPGGKFFIYTGMLKYLLGEHELVALMAHEMYYSDKEKAMDIIIKEFKSVPFLLGDIYLGNEVEQAKDVAVYMRDYAYDPNVVAAADEYALRLICPFQYNPSGLAQFVERSMSLMTVDWLIKRTGFMNRVDALKSLQGDCGNIENDPTFSERYMTLVKTLP